MKEDHSKTGGANIMAMNKDMGKSAYQMFAANLLASGIVMYLAMFTMIWSSDEFFNNANMFYMALVMWAPMGILMLLMMPMMYPNKKLNMVLLTSFALVLILSFWAIRDQALVGDRQFVRAMIPHHSGAITMCNRASIRDQEIREICFKPNGIIESQKREIAQMEAILKRL
ncbi:MAG: DUF305 domain-containing protein [Pseudomonadota bacterium]